MLSSALLAGPALAGSGFLGSGFTGVAYADEVTGPVVVQGPDGEQLPLPPPAAVVTGPSGPSAERSPAWSWTSPPDGSSTCTLLLDGAATSVQDCSAPWTPPGGLLSDGVWQLEVLVADARRLPAADVGRSPVYVLDTVAPAAPTVTFATPSGSGPEPAVSLATDDPGARFACRVLRPSGSVLTDWADCGPSTQTALTPGLQGAWVLQARATDTAGNTGAVGSGTYTLDTTPPAAPVVVVAPAGGSARTPVVSFTSDAGTTTACRTSGADGTIDAFGPCTSPVTLFLEGKPDGPYTLEVRALDQAGNRSLGSATYALDTTPPATTALDGPPATGSASPWTWRWSLEPGASATCTLSGPTGTRLDGPCASGVSVPMTTADNGTWTFTFTTTDAAGNARTQVATYVHVASLPTLTVTAPASPSSGRTPSWAVATSPDTTATCTLGRETGLPAAVTVQGPEPCMTGFTAARLAVDGLYTLRVTVTDVLGQTAENVSTWELDTTPPDATLVLSATTSSTTTPTLTASALGPLASATCRVIGVGAARACTVAAAGSVLPFDLTGRADGTYVFELVVVDTAGNRSVSTVAYRLDRLAPAAPRVDGPRTPGTSATPSWQLPGLAAGELLRCTLTGPGGVAAPVDCLPGTFTTALVDQGSHVLTAVVVDEAGNTSEPTSRAYVFDSIAPDLGPVVLSGPSPTSSRTATWTFVVPEGATAACSVTYDGDEVASGPCTSPYSLALTGRDGTYRLQVVPTDAAGNSGSASVGTVTLDTAAPAAATVIGRPGSPSRLDRPVWSFTTPPGTTATCALLRGRDVVQPAQPCRESFTARLTEDGDHRFSVYAVDAAGNASGPATDDYRYRRDAAPGVVFAQSPRGFVADPAVSWRFSTEPGTALVCALFREGRQVRAPRACAGTAGFVLTEEGRYELQVAVVGAPREAQPAISGFTLDLTDPLPLRVQTDLRAAGRSPDVAWRWSVPDDDVVLVECRLVRDGGAGGTGWRDCTGRDTWTSTLPEQGEWVLQLRSTDRAGRTSGQVSSAAYRYDTQPPPAAPVSSAAGTGGSADEVAWTFGPPADVTATCTLLVEGRVLQGPQDCTAGRYIAGLSFRSPGTYQLLVRYVDAAGNESTVTTSYALARGEGSILRPVGATPAPPPPAASPAPAPAPQNPTQPAARAAAAAASRSRLPAPVAAVPAPRPLPPVPAAVGRVALRAPSALPPLPSADGLALTDPDEVGRPSFSVPALPDGLPGAVFGTLEQAVKQPALPVALGLLVLAFLLVQNRIDRRDPKLATAPLDAEPELSFGPVLRGSDRG